MPRPIRILVVDDEHWVADTLGSILHQAGYEVMVTYKGSEAIAAAHTFRPDTVIADYFMPPGINGIQTCLQINQVLPSTRIIMLSGHLLAEEFARYQTEGYDFLFLSKPMHPTELLKAVAA